MLLFLLLLFLLSLLLSGAAAVGGAAAEGPDMDKRDLLRLCRVIETRRCNRAGDEAAKVAADDATATATVTGEEASARQEPVGLGQQAKQQISSSNTGRASTSSSTKEEETEMEALQHLLPHVECQVGSEP